MAKILDQHGNPIDRAVLDGPQTKREASLANLQSNYLTPMLNGLTPARLANILREADNGNLIEQHRLFADMEERNPHLAAEMGKRINAPLTIDWDIVPPRNANAAEKKAAAWAKEVLEDAVDPIEDLIVAMGGATGHGFAPVEMEWNLEGKELLPSFFPRPQEWFRLDQTRSFLRLIDASVDGVTPASFGWIIHTPGKAKTGYMGRLGLHRVLSWPFIYGAYGLSDFAEFLETFGLPFIIGKYFSGASPEEKASLMRAVTALGHDARAIMPTEMQLEISKITGSGDSTPHMAMVDWAERSISKVILGQTTSSEAKPTGLGSGVADLHSEVRDDILRADARQIAATLTRDLVYPLIALNRGGIDGLRRCPRLKFDLAEADDLVAYAGSLPKLVGVGFHIPREWAQERLRIPEPADGEEILTIAQPEKILPPDERPLPASNAPSTALSALSAGTPQAAATDPLAGDTDELASAADPAFNAIIDDIGKMIDGAADLATLQADLIAKYGGFSSDRLRNIMAAAFALAQLKGMDSAREGV